MIGQIIPVINYTLNGNDVATVDRYLNEVTNKKIKKSLLDRTLIILPGFEAVAHIIWRNDLQASCYRSFSLSL